MKSLRLLAAAVMVLWAVVAHADPLCYYAPGKRGPDDFIPCYTGRSDEPTYCCKRGGKCTEQNSCWDSITGVTFQYGCTDPTYKHSSCPRKCGLDTAKSNWVGLIWCSNSWLCHHPDNCGKDCSNPDLWSPTLAMKPPQSKCENMNKSLVAFNAPNPLRDILPLASKSEDLASYFSANRPASSKDSSTAKTTATASTTAATVSSASISTGLPPTASYQTSPSNSDIPEQSHTPPKKGNSGVAIGVGAGVSIVLAAIIGSLIYYFRRRRKLQAQAEGKDSHGKYAAVQPGYSDSGMGGTSGTQSGPGYAFKAELPADDRPIHEMETPLPSPAKTLGTTPSEMEGSTYDGRSLAGTTPNSPQGSEFTDKSRADVYRMSGGLPHDISEVDGNHVHELPA